MEFQKTEMKKPEASSHEVLDEMRHTLCDSMETAAKNFAPLTGRVSSVNLEVLSFFSRRARAYLEVPGRAAACQTPQDAVAAQMAFWREAANHYSEATTRIVSAWSGTSAPVANGSGALTAGIPVSAVNPWSLWMNAWMGPTGQTKPRDYLMLQDKKSTAQGADKSPEGGRKAA